MAVIDAPTWHGHLHREGGTLTDANGYDMALSLNGRTLEGRLPGKDAVLWSGPVNTDGGNFRAVIIDRWGFELTIDGTLKAGVYTLTAELTGVPKPLAIPMVDDGRVRA